MINRRTATVAPIAETTGRRSARLRLRVAWMYYAEEMTQGAIAEKLGIGRVTVTRLLADARAMHEVSITLSRGISDLPELEIGLEKKFGLREAVVAPLSAADGDPTTAIGAATGGYISDFVHPDMTLGVGWGKTLFSSLDYVDQKQVDTVVSLLGGISNVQHYNPAEFAWQFSRMFRARCYLITAPAIVDSVETKSALIERCGIGGSFAISETLDAVLLSVGGVQSDRIPGAPDYISESTRRELVRAGAVGNVLYNYFDAAGDLVDHPLNTRVMSVPLANLRKTPERIVASGGTEKVAALRGAMALLQPTVLITDEITAATLLRDA